MYKIFFKRFIDILASVSVLIIILPLLCIISIVIFLQDFGPVIFKQRRVGINGEVFNFYKFRSMPVNTPSVESHETKKLVITPFGKFIRRTNIDELPQLVNILKGDMSLIGPRPPIESQVKLIELRKENGALSCKPGLTGLAQVSSYDNMPEEEKAKFDGIYIKDINFINDVKIIFRTLTYLTKKPPTY
ncbi:sugar transferase [Myroides odoratimimus]|uniref:sugar transferase n=1 Tax=Myroides odoratimimus TaxID=76832 RepID=UPI00103B3836|nr:sugar transferase [Myroides odoratimimus]QBK77611.1 sugar transferase [Myroides odoratimimus]WHT73058.1 sugar transferase [Myroides odoratimimus]WHU37641.1 sugar transferase [Myroides odoratimimus]